MKYANAVNVKQYKKLPKSEREDFGFWYRLPKMYELDGESFEDYWKENYPFQFFVRNTLENFWITISVWKDKFIDNIWRRCFPRNQWAREVIPHTYSDKPELIQDFLFASIIDFVENEPVYDTDWLSDKKRKEIWSKIDKSYKFAKYTLPARKKRINEMLSESYNEESFMKFDDKPENAIIKELSELEKQTEIEIQQNLVEIVKIRQFLWT